MTLSLIKKETETDTALQEVIYSVTKQTNGTLLRTHTDHFGQ